MLITDQKITSYYFRLASCADSPNVARNEKEMHLIHSLERMLDQYSEERPLSEHDLAVAEYKTRKVSCFSERYLDIVQHLREYQQEKMSQLLPAKTA